MSIALSERMKEAAKVLFLLHTTPTAPPPPPGPFKTQSPKIGAGENSIDGNRRVSTDIKRFRL